MSKLLCWLCDRIWCFLEKFTPLAKILHCRRQWREWQISPLQVISHQIGIHRIKSQLLLLSSVATGYPQIRKGTPIVIINHWQWIMANNASLILPHQIYSHKMASKLDPFILCAAAVCRHNRQSMIGWSLKVEQFQVLVKMDVKLRARGCGWWWNHAFLEEYSLPLAQNCLPWLTMQL